jgi:diacylglycerol kinase family enzyme
VEHPVDLIDCNGRYSINVCSVGIDARIGTDVHRYSAIPILGGPTGYVVSLVVNFIKGINEYYEIRTPDGDLKGEFALVCACNGRYYGGGFNPVPDAMPDDGLIDFLVVNRVSLLKAMTVILKYAKGRYREMGGIIAHLRGKSLEINCRKPVVVNVDGEAVCHQQIRFSIVSGGISFVFPAEMQFYHKKHTDSEEIMSNTEI